MASTYALVYVLKTCQVVCGALGGPYVTCAAAQTCADVQTTRACPACKYWDKTTPGKAMLSCMC